MEINKKIAHARKKAGFTQEQLAELTNITVRTIQRIENGKNIPRTFTIKTIATALGTTYEELTEELQNEDSFERSNEQHFLKMLCLSCFGYLIIPLVHFLIPICILKKSGSSNPKIIEFGRSAIRQQIYWVVTLCFLLLITLAYNFIVVIYFKELFLLHYLWIFFIMYIINASLIAVNLWRIKKHINY